MIIDVHGGDTWTRADSGDTEGAARLGRQHCCICHKLETLVLSCSDHYICAEHQPTHEDIATYCTQAAREY